MLMKLMKVNIAIVCLAFLLPRSACAITADPSTAPITLGRWHSSLDKGRTYAQNNGVPMLYVWGSSLCTYCAELDTVMDTQLFKDWQAQRQLVMVYIKHPTSTITPEATYAREGQNPTLNDLPLVCLLWSTKNPLPDNFTGRFAGTTTDAKAQNFINRIESYIADYTAVGLSIVGDTQMFDTSTAQYQAYFKDANGVSTDVSSLVSWGINNATYGSVSAQGIFTPSDTTQSRQVTITASYQGGAYTDTHSVTVYDKLYPPSTTLLSVAIDGPSQVHGGTSAQYRCLLDYGIGLLFETGGSVAATWTESSPVITITSGGLLSSTAVTADTATPLIARVTIGAVVKQAVKYVTITRDPPAPVYELVVIGTNSVVEGSTAQYTALLRAAGESDQDVTATAVWSLQNEPAGTTITQGQLTAGDVTADTICTVQADYDGQSASTSVTIVDNPVNLIFLEVNGPEQITEGTSESYSCTAYYSDETFADVTTQAQWSLSVPAAGSVDANGVVTAALVAADTPVTVSAAFGGETGEKAVTVINVVIPLDRIEVTGPATVNEVTTADYVCTAFYTDASSENVTASAVWSVTHASSSISAGRLTAGSVTTDESCAVEASFGGQQDSLSIQIIDTPAQGIPYMESFEAGLGLWSNEAGGLQWTVNSGPTLSPGTGPSAAADGASYLYTEASGNTNQSAAVEAQFSIAGVAVPFLIFDYHMYGVDCGLLQVDIFDGQWNESVWSRAGIQQDDSSSEWLTAKVDLSSFADAGLITVRFKGITGVTYLSDIAIDNIRLIDFSQNNPQNYDEWVVIEQVPAGTQGGGDMPFNDGIPNWVKYASGLSGDSHMTQDYMNLDRTTNVFGIIYYKDRSVTDVELQPVWAYSLNGFWSAQGITPVKIGEEGERDIWRALIPQDGGEADKGFMRLRAVEAQ